MKKEKVLLNQYEFCYLFKQSQRKNKFKNLQRLMKLSDVNVHKSTFTIYNTLFDKYKSNIVIVTMGDIE